MNAHPTFAIKTLGCKVNQYETQGIREVLVRAGYREARWPDKADLYIINTCTVTAVSDRKSRRFIKEAAKSNPKGKLVVTGCYAEKDSAKISSLCGVDFVVPNKEKHNIVNIISGGKNSGGRRAASGDFLLKITGFNGHSRAFVKVEDGCNNFCSFCKVPLVRGRVKSRPLPDIIDEAHCLSDKGFKEIVLSGICLGAYGIDLPQKQDITDVLRELEKIGNGFRLRLSSIEPAYVTDRLIREMAGSKVLCPHLHIPLQNGDDAILKKMNRNYDVRAYKALIRKIRKSIPHIALTTDILVGFPGETEANFRNTLNTLKEIAPSRVHIFPYSPREGTTAFNLKGRIPPRIVRERIERLEELTRETAFAYRKRFLGKKAELLIESKRDKKNGLLTGYSDTYIKVLVRGSDTLMNRIVPVKIKDVRLDCTIGEIA